MFCLPSWNDSEIIFKWATVLVCAGCYNKIAQTGWFHQRKFIFSQLWRPGVQDQGANRCSFSWGLSAWFTDGHLPSLSSCRLSSAHVRPGVSFSSDKKTSPIRLGPPCVCVSVWLGVCVSIKSLSRVQLYDPMGYSLPGSSVHGILQARILKWVAIPLSRGSSQPRDQTHVSYVSCTGRWILYHCTSWEALGPP